MNQLKLAIGTSFTADPLSDFTPFWSRILGTSVDFSLTSAAILYQTLLTPGSGLNDLSASRFLLVRWSDFGRDARRAASELASAVNATGIKFTIFICPEQQGDASPTVIEEFCKALDAQCQIVDVAEIFARYDIADPFDAHANNAASVPYSREAFAALSAELVRRAHAAQRPPLKLVAVDCDNTLWRGVVGEDGVTGISADPAAKQLQHRLSVLSDAGVTIALLSKNMDNDVVSVFEQRPDMPLTLDHILARGVNWCEKSENLVAIAQQFGVSDASILFLDDNPIEIAAMRTRMPGVVSVLAPPVAAFAEHLWLLDAAPATHEDRERRNKYRDDTARRNEAHSAPTLKAFIDSLELNVDIAEANVGDIARLAQLTQRTNQFNTTLHRFTEPELAAWAEAPDHKLFAVSARDRFGDYGIVGVIGLEYCSTHHRVSLFALSCRALGRGVEHQMVAHIGDIAKCASGSEVAFAMAHGPRNEPAWHFLAELIGRAPAEGDNTIDAATLAEVRFDTTTAPAPQVPNEPTIHAKIENPLVTWSYIANDLTTGHAILRAVVADRKTMRKVQTTFVAPARGIESDIARIWEDILSVSPIGAQDDFTALGGKSIDLVQVHSRLVKLLRRPVDLTLLFECSTPAQLARRLNDQETRADKSVSARANAMAHARDQRMRRFKEVRETMQ